MTSISDKAIGFITTPRCDLNKFSHFLAFANDDNRQTSCLAKHFAPPSTVPSTCVHGPGPLWGNETNGEIAIYLHTYMTRLGAEEKQALVFAQTSGRSHILVFFICNLSLPGMRSPYTPPLHSQWHEVQHMFYVGLLLCNHSASCSLRWYSRHAAESANKETHFTVFQRKNSNTHSFQPFFRLDISSYPAQLIASVGINYLGIRIRNSICRWG